MTEVLRPEHICPRCEGFIPNESEPGAYPGALSRTDNKTELCSRCGTDEAMEDFTGNRLTPQNQWPINKWHPLTVQMMDATKNLHEKFADFEVEMHARGVKEEFDA